MAAYFSYFVNDLDVSLVDSGPPQLWELDKPFLYYSDILGSIVEIPKGFRTDFASVPRAPFAYWLTGGFAPQASTIHDYLVGTSIDRDVADFIFLEALKAEGVAYWRRQLMYFAVHAYSRWLRWTT